MINKIYKIIHNRFSRFFNFFFFLRYLFAIFLITITLFISIPKFFNYEKKQDIIKTYLDNYYNLELQSFNTIKFNIFPFPNLSIENPSLKIKDNPIFFKVKNLHIFLNLNNIYRYENLKPKKIIFNETNTTLEINQIKEILKYFDNLENRFDIKSLNVNLKKNNKILFDLKDLYFSNYGYKKYQISGKIFNKKFKAFLKNENKDLNFKIYNTGIKANFKFDEKALSNAISGSSQISFPNNYIKFNFKFYKDRIEIIKSNLRNRDLSISFNSIIKIIPFFDIKSNITVNQFDKNLVNNLNLKKIVNEREIIKKLNSSNTISFEAKKYSKSLIRDFFSEFNLVHGRLIFSKNIFISGGNIECKGESLLISEYPRLNFLCLFNLKDTKKIIKKFPILKKIKLKPINLNIEGSLNILNNKINFNKINSSEGYEANQEDIQYFKRTFEKILFNESFFEIFKTRKLEEFLLAII